MSFPSRGNTTKLKAGRPVPKSVSNDIDDVKKRVALLKQKNARTPPEGVLNSRRWEPSANRGAAIETPSTSLYPGAGSASRNNRLEPVKRTTAPKPRSGSLQFPSMTHQTNQGPKVTAPSVVATSSFTAQRPTKERTPPGGRRPRVLTKLGGSKSALDPLSMLSPPEHQKTLASSRTPLTNSKTPSNEKTARVVMRIAECVVSTWDGFSFRGDINLIQCFLEHRLEHRQNTVHEELLQSIAKALEVDRSEVNG